jgi:hypothetical protein
MLAGSRWTTDGVGEATGWESIALATRAVRSLGSLGTEYAGEYRIVDEQSREVVQRMRLCATQRGGRVTVTWVR